MQVSDLIALGDVVAHVKVSTKAQLLKELARRASAIVKFEESVILKALTDREHLGSTGVGGGIALPHARLKGLAKNVGMVLTLSRPIDFHSVDDLPVDIVGMLLMPDETQAEANAALACFARRFREPGVADRIRKSKVADELYGHLTA